MGEMTAADLANFRAAVRLRDRCVDAAVARFERIGIPPSPTHARVAYDAMAEIIRADERQRLAGPTQDGAARPANEPERAEPTPAGMSGSPDALRASETGAGSWLFRDVQLPPADTEDHRLVTAVRQRINDEARLNLLGAKAVWALVQAIRAERPDGDLDRHDQGLLDAVAARAGMNHGGVRLRMAYLVMTALIEETAGEDTEVPPDGGR